MDDRSKKITLFGQMVIGPSGSGKTTYCNGMQQLINSIDRKVAVVNLDPANDTIPYECAVDICELITVADVMDKLNLGPNGALVYCIEYLEANFDWLYEKLLNYEDSYIILDCPGQIELYTHHDSMRDIIKQLMKRTDFRLCTVSLFDSHFCSDPSTFISVVMTSLATMMQIELPTINVLSKVDLIEKQGPIHFGIDFYTEVQDLTYLLDLLPNTPFYKKYMKLNTALIRLIEDYSLVSYHTLNIQDKQSALTVLRAVDRAIGYASQDTAQHDQRNIQKLLSDTMGANFEYFKTADVRERYIEEDGKENKLE